MLVSFTAQAQNRMEVPARVIGQDTMPYLFLKPVQVVSKRQFKSKAHKRRFDRLYRDVVKVYPYARKAGEVFQEIDAELAALPNRKARRAHAKRKEAILKAEFEQDLRKMTIRQGIILIKLVDREVGHNCYYLVKELRGSLQAFFWQSIARIFGHNLKNEYDPEMEEDIEIIIRSLENS